MTFKGVFMEKQAMFLWNSGADRDAFIRRFGSSELYDKLEAKYGCASIPVHILYGFALKEPSDPEIRRHRGLDGPGKMLRDIITAQRCTPNSP